MSPSRAAAPKNGLHDPRTGIESAILVVDDDDAVRTMVAEYLETAGYTVITATDGTVGLAAFKQNRATVRLLLTDVAMPSMNGMDLADRIRELDENLPVLFMSGTATGADRGYGCVEKPFRAAELIERVGAALHIRPGLTLEDGESASVRQL